MNNLSWPKFILIRYIMFDLDTCKLAEVLVNSETAIAGTNLSPLITLWDIFVAIVTTVLNQFVPNCMQSTPNPNMSIIKIVEDWLFV